MHWHAETSMEMRLLVGPAEWIEVTRLTLRGYAVPGGYEARMPFSAVLQADLIGATATRRAFLHGMLRADGREFCRSDWQSIARLLLDQFHIDEAIFDRHGREVIMDAKRWAGTRSAEPKTL